jgi:hypothetical protein
MAGPLPLKRIYRLCYRLVVAKAISYRSNQSGIEGVPQPPQGSEGVPIIN